MATVRERMLPVAARLRDVVDSRFGHRRFTVYLRRRTPSDSAGGIGAVWTVVDTLLAEKPRVRSANAQDVVESAGRIQASDMILDQITPRNDAGTVGVTPATLDIQPTSDGQDVFFVLVGPDTPAYVGGATPSGGAEYTPVWLDFTGNYSFKIGIRPRSGGV